jgi:hypothetical protein
MSEDVGKLYEGDFASVSVLRCVFFFGFVVARTGGWMLGVLSCIFYSFSVLFGDAYSFLAN